MSDTSDALLAAYPGAHLAVCWCELFLAANSYDDRDAFALMRDRVPPLSLDETIALIREAIQEPVNDGAPGEHVKALVQTHTTDFRRYVAAKLGLM